MTLDKPHTEIEKEVKEKLAFEPSVDVKGIKIAIDSGVVTLFGTVNSYFQKVVAERLTKGIEEVKGVANEIKVGFSC